MYPTFPLLSTIILLIFSNFFMIFAWYGHLKFKNYPLYAVILVSWGIAFFEYCFQITANRFGCQYFSIMQLRIMQEIITLIIFIGFSVLYLGEAIKLNHVIGLTLVACGAVIVSYR